MRWAEFTIITTEDASDAISEMLAQIGADGIAVTDPWEIKRIIDDPASLSYADGGFVNSLGEDVTVRAYFAELDGLVRLGPKAEEYVDEFDTTAIYGNITGSRVTVQEALEILKKQLDNIAQFLDIGKGFDSWKYVEDQDWENEWKKDYKAFRISDRVVICPSWESFDAAPSDVVVSLDPGSAFGTGTHETTSTCAKLLDTAVEPGQKIYRGKGCSECNDKGYKGRIAIHEVVVITRGMKTLLEKRAPEDEMRTLAVKEGTQMLMDSALALVVEGITTIAEANRVAYSVDG